MSVYKGKCFCGAVEIMVDGDPVGAGYCHCASCRSWSAGPRQRLHPLEVGRREGYQGRGERGRSHRKWCRICGGHLFTEHPEWNLVDVYAATIPEFPFKAGVHVNYAQTVLRNEGWPSQVEGLPSGTRGHGRNGPRVATVCTDRNRGVVFGAPVWVKGTAIEVWFPLPRR